MPTAALFVADSGRPWKSDFFLTNGEAAMGSSLGALFAAAGLAASGDLAV